MLNPDGPPAEAFAYRLVKLRDEIGLTTAQLAAMTDYSEADLAEATSGRELPSWELTAAYISACGDNPEQWRPWWDHARKSAVPVVPVPPPAATGLRFSTGPGVRWGVAIGLVVLVVLGIVLWPKAKSPASVPPVATALSACSNAAATVTVAASVDKSKQLAELASSYGPHESGGQCVKIDVTSVDSGTAMAALARGWTEKDGRKPDVWSPAASVWLPLAKQRATPETQALFPDEAGQSITTSPSTIAMPEPMARALGWPEAKVGWEDLATWSGDPHFWASKGHPEWGAFKLGKTNPNFSTSGINATLGALFSTIGSIRELRPDDVDKDAVAQRMKAIEHSVVHYGKTTLTFLANLRQAETEAAGAEAYISAVTMEENSVVAYNAGYTCGSYSDDEGCSKTDPPKTKLVAIYPKEGVLFSDHPFIELNGLDGPRKAVADDFLTYLRSDTVQKEFAKYGFRDFEQRPIDPDGPNYGWLPKAEIKSLGTPTGEVVARLLASWAKLRKPTNVLVCIDSSLSMEEKVPGTGATKLALVKPAIRQLADGFTDSDRVGLWKFSSGIGDGGTDFIPLVPIGPMDGTRRADLAANIDGLTADGATGLYDTIDAAVDSVRATYDPNSINAVVLLTDGVNDKARGIQAPAELVAAIKGKDASGDKPVRVFTIAYGSELDANNKAGAEALATISKGTGAKKYDAKDPTTITNVIIDVLSNF
ncbi:substrate-binding domain-containing protein [Umezawaea sp. NPDC059074]|uniref:substrate-binding domain-containing protein n=1 Tax=Umezawaea sp. NPDC059074 TaxID=3346716 RepID=UPI0036872CF9